MNKQIPISISKYERFLRKLLNYFFPKKNLINFYNNYPYKDINLFGTELFHRNTSGFKNYITQNQYYDKKQLFGAVNKQFVEDTIHKFINFPKIPKTYLKRKDCNYYIYDSHVSTFVESTLNIKDLKEASNDLHLIPALTAILNQYSIFMSAIERGYYFTKNTDLSESKFYITNDAKEVSDLINLINALPNNLPFLISISRANSVVSLGSNADLKDNYNFDPLRWKDNYSNSKLYFDKILHKASKNSILSQTALLIKIQTLNYDFLQYNSQKIINTYKQINPEFSDKYKNYWLNEKFSSNKSDNAIYLKYFFYEFIDYEEYI